MFSVLEASDEEELPVFLASGERLADPKGTIQPPPVENKVVMLCSSDSEGSSTASPAWKKSCGVQDSAKGASHVQTVSLLSSDSEEDEDEELIPLAERLKMKILHSSSSTADPSFTKILEPKDHGLAEGSQLLNNNEKTAVDCRQQLQQPRHRDPQRRTAPNTWELSDSDGESASSDLRKEPVVCGSDSLVESMSHQVAEMCSRPYSFQTRPKHSQEDLNRNQKTAVQKRKMQVAQKMLKEQERERKKALANLWRAQRPEECLKHIQVVLDPGLLQAEGGGHVLATLQGMDCTCVIENQAVPCSMTWRRKLGQGEDHSWAEEPNLLVLVLPEKFAALVHNSKQVTEEGTRETLQSFVANILEENPSKILALASVEVEKYFSCNKHKAQKKLQQAVQIGSGSWEQDKGGKSHSVLHLSRVDVEEALVGLQIHTGVQVRILESWKEFGDFVSMFTKAVAEAPFKRERDTTSFSFCLEGDWSRGMKVDRFGKGLLQVWKRQIQQFNRVSQEMASAIVARYPSPLLLKQAYDTLSSEQERHHLLAAIPVRRGDGITATTRRIGPELSKRIYLHMTSHNADLSLDITG